MAQLQAVLPVACSRDVAGVYHRHAFEPFLSIEVSRECYAVEALSKDTLNKGHLILSRSNTFPYDLTTELRTPPYKGQFQESQWCPL